MGSTGDVQRAPEYRREELQYYSYENLYKYNAAFDLHEMQY